MQVVRVNLLDRTYDIKCSPEEEENLLRAVDYLNQNLKHHLDSSFVTFTDALVVSALNTCDLLLKAKENDITSLSQSNSRLNLVHQQVKKLLSENERRR